MQDNGKLKLPPGKIAGDEDERRHVEGYDEPFQSVQKIIVLIAWLDEMPHDYQRDQKRFVVVQQVIALPLRRCRHGRLCSCLCVCDYVVCPADHIKHLA